MEFLTMAITCVLFFLSFMLIFKCKDISDEINKLKESLDELEERNVELFNENYELKSIESVVQNKELYNSDFVKRDVSIGTIREIIKDGFNADFNSESHSMSIKKTMCGHVIELNNVMISKLDYINYDSCVIRISYNDNNFDFVANNLESVYLPYLYCHMMFIFDEDGKVSAKILKD